MTDLANSRTAHCLLHPDQIDQFVLSQSGADFAAFEQFRRQIALVPMEGEDALFDTTLHDQAVDRHRPLLADAMGTVRRLILDRRIPPRIEVNDIIRSRQVQPGATGPPADQEQVRCPRLKRGDPALAIRGWRAAIEIFIGDPALIEGGADQGQRTDELAEHQCPMPVADQFRDQRFNAGPSKTPP